MSNNWEKLKVGDGELLLFSGDNGIYQVRLYKGARRYIFKSLRTKKYEEAVQLATREFYDLDFKKRNELPIAHTAFSQVLNQYLNTRRNQLERGTHRQVNKVAQQSTSPANMRQMERVSKFLHEYYKNTPVDKITEKMLEGYVDWRIDYYKRIPKNKLPKKYSLIPADKTLQWETVFTLTILKYAKQQGYLGVQSVPKYFFKAQRNVTRPSFSLQQYRDLYRGIRRWINEGAATEERQYTRLLLRDYVLILANSGIRIGEANNLRETDVQPITDEQGRKVYRLIVEGKTGRRDCILRANATRYVERVFARNAEWADKNNRQRHNRRQKLDDGLWFFRMSNGNKIINLVDQFTYVLEKIDLKTNDKGEHFSLYSLRHFYAVQSLRRGISVFAVARNMGTSVEIIQKYYGKDATPLALATELAS